MKECKNCKYGVYAPIRDEQVGHERRRIDNWECEHPNEGIRKQSKQKGWAKECPEFRLNHP